MPHPSLISHATDAEQASLDAGSARVLARLTRLKIEAAKQAAAQRRHAARMQADPAYRQRVLDGEEALGEFERADAIEAAERAQGRADVAAYHQRQQPAKDDKAKQSAAEQAEQDVAQAKQQAEAAAPWLNPAAAVKQAWADARQRHPKVSSWIKLHVFDGVSSDAVDDLQEAQQGAWKVLWGELAGNGLHRLQRLCNRAAKVGEQHHAVTAALEPVMQAWQCDHDEQITARHVQVLLYRFACRLAAGASRAQLAECPAEIWLDDAGGLAFRRNADCDAHDHELRLPGDQWIEVYQKNSPFKQPRALPWGWPVKAILQCDDTNRWSVRLQFDQSLTSLEEAEDLAATLPSIANHAHMIIGWHLAAGPKSSLRALARTLGVHQQAVARVIDGWKAWTAEPKSARGDWYSFLATLPRPRPAAAEPAGAKPGQPNQVVDPAGGDELEALAALDADEQNADEQDDQDEDENQDQEQEIYDD